MFIFRAARCAELKLQFESKDEYLTITPTVATGILAGSGENVTLVPTAGNYSVAIALATENTTIMGYSSWVKGADSMTATFSDPEGRPLQVTKNQSHPNRITFVIAGEYLYCLNCICLTRIVKVV